MIAEKFAKTDPDIYPLLNGVRVKPTSDEHPPWQPCTANPRTVELAIQEINRYFDEHPEAQKRLDAMVGASVRRFGARVPAPIAAAALADAVRRYQAEGAA
jgi:hypothetical protein